ncbi:Ig-like domain-containing protein [Enterococcus termitis]
MRWSVHFNELGYEVPDQITATLTNLTTGKTEQMQNDSLGGELTVVRAKPGYYAQGGYATVVFRPNNQYIVNKNDLYKVEITGLKKAGQPYVHTYTTRFIGMNDEYKAEEIPISELKLSPKTAKLTVGKSQSLKAEISPETATNRTLSWSSNKPSVATVDEKGTVTGKTQGECVITVKDSTGKVSDSAVITVGNEETILVERVLPLYDYYKNIDINEEIFLNAIVYPKEASNQGYSFFVSEKDEPYVTIDPVKKTFKASKAGPYNVYVKSDDGNYVSQHVGFLMFNVGTGYYVEDNFFMYLGDPIKPEDRIRVESVSLPEKLTLSIDEGITLQPTIMPENASNKSCHFDSSDSSIVEVTHSEDGELVARKKGTATITVYTNNGALVPPVKLQSNNERNYATLNIQIKIIVKNVRRHSAAPHVLYFNLKPSDRHVLHNQKASFHVAMLYTRYSPKLPPNLKAPNCLER